ncbi:MAG: ATP--guanido phosphotransferase [Planctomycetes bacterium]|nr:ATP--guanido phosphotransferase [Planctomycetota bacterium]
MTDPFVDFPRSVGGWLESAEGASPVVLSTRIRLARNVLGYNFVSRLSPVRAVELVGVLRERAAAAGIAPELRWFAMSELDELRRQALVERHLISKELARSELEAGVLVGDRERISIMINEEDHLRLQVLRGGFDLDDAWSEIERIDRALERVVPYAYSAELGYLTACPTNVGTGLRLSVMLHLPALALVPDELKRVFHAAARTNLAVRGLHGEGTSAAGNMYQVSNQVTLGRSELQILEDLSHVVPSIVRFEERVRQTLFSERRDALDRRVATAKERLLGSEEIATDQALGLLSDLRLGLDLGLVHGIPEREPSRLMVLLQPGHLQLREGLPLGPRERDRARARMLRRELSGLV